MRSLRLFLAFSLVAAPSYATEFGTCFRALAFAAPSGGPPPLELIEGTLRELLTELGGKLAPDQAAEMARSENPFALPERSNQDLLSLRRRLLQFEEMLKNSGWRTPEVAQRARQVLGEVAGGKAAAGLRLQRVVEGPFLKRIPLVDAPGFQVTPEGRWIVTEETMSNGPIGQNHPFHSIDTGSGFTIRADLPRLAGLAVLSRDGKSLLIPHHDQTVIEIPFENGHILWNRKKQNGTPVLPRLAEVPKAAIGEQSGRVYASFAADKMNLLSQSGERIPLTLADGSPARAPHSWGVVSGTDDLYVNEAQGAELVVKRMTFQPDGVGTLVAEWRLPSSATNSQILVGPDSQLLLHHRTRGELDLYPTPGGPPLSIPIPPKERGSSALQSFQISPNEKHGTALVVDSTQTPARVHLIRFHLGNGAVTDDVEVPETHGNSLRLSPDGKVAYFSSHYHEVVQVRID